MTESEKTTSDVEDIKKQMEDWMGSHPFEMVCIGLTCVTLISFKALEICIGNAIFRGNKKTLKYIGKHASIVTNGSNAIKHKTILL